MSFARRFLLIVIPLCWSGAAALAHPMGNFSINHYTSLRVEGDEIRVRYRVDLAEIPAALELNAPGAAGKAPAGGGKEMTPDGRAAFLAKKVPELTAGQSLKVDGAAVALAVVSSEARLRPGAAELPTLLLTIDYRAALPPAARPPPPGAKARRTIEYADHNFEERAGWREIVASAGGGYGLAQSSVPGADRSHALEAYPADLTEAPPQDREAWLVVIRLASPAAPVAPLAAPVPSDPAGAGRNTGTPQDRFTQLMNARTLSPAVLLLSLGVAFVLGSFHALAPGHGKTVVAAYLVGSRGTARHAMLLGGVVTLTHVVGVFTLGLLVYFAKRYVEAEDVYPWLGFVSGLMIVALGVWQFTRRYALLLAARRSAASKSAAAVPRDGSIAGPAPDAAPLEYQPLAVAGHVHGPGGHTHELPDRITFAGLIALGVSGGIVPCPSALVVLLGAIALRRVGFGLVLIVAFSLGLASVLIAIGLLMVYARRLFDRFNFEGKTLRRLPLVSPLVVGALGAFIAVQSVSAGRIFETKAVPHAPRGAADGPAADPSARAGPAGAPLATWLTK